MVNILGIVMSISLLTSIPSYGEEELGYKYDYANNIVRLEEMDNIIIDYCEGHYMNVIYKNDVILSLTHEKLDLYITNIAKYDVYKDGFDIYSNDGHDHELQNFINIFLTDMFFGIHGAFPFIHYKIEEGDSEPIRELCKSNVNSYISPSSVWEENNMYIQSVETYLDSYSIIKLIMELCRFE